MLILEYFCKNSFCASRNTRMVYSASTAILNTHSSSMHCIELVLCVIGSWGSLPSGRSRIGSTLCNWWPLNIKFSWLAGYQILCLIAAWLNHQTLVHIILILLGHISSNRAGVDRLPSVFRIVLNLPMGSNLHHTIHQCLVILTLMVSAWCVANCTALFLVNDILLPLGIFLCY